MPKKLADKMKEALRALLPITIIVLVLNFTVVPMPFEVRGMFITGAVLLAAGMGLFILGADLALLPIGEHLGQYLSKSRRPALIIVSVFILGTGITASEPGFAILAPRIPGAFDGALMLAVAVSVGVFLVIAIIRILLQWSLRYILFALYLFIFILALFIPDSYMSAAFDASGITTGPLTVPLILAFGVGISGVRGGKSSEDDSFGLVALASAGTIIVIMILMIFNKVSHPKAGALADLSGADTFGSLLSHFMSELQSYTVEMAIALLPVTILFLLFQVTAIKLPASQLIKMFVGIIYIFAGMVLFLTGVNTGFLPAGFFMGQSIGASYPGLLIPLGIIIGYFIVRAEPAVHVLIDQIEDLTGGAVSKKVMLNSLSVSVALAMGLAMLRICLGINLLWILIPGYLLALLLSFAVPKIFTAIAFDSGGAASGPMSTTFLFPFAMGASFAVGGDIFPDTLGTVAIIAMAPMFTLQIVGLIYRIKVAHTTNDEWGTISDIANAIEEREFPDWGESNPNSEVYDDYKGVDVENMEFVASPEWAESIHDENVWQEITTDNAYIDFDEIEMKHYQSMVIPEDFEISGKRGKIE